MAWHTITHSCGHQDRHQLTGPSKTREWRASKLAEEPCADCWKAQREAENQAAAARNAEAGLPALTGTEAQIRWAEGLRAERLERLERIGRFLSRDLDRNELACYFSEIDRNDPALPRLLDALQSQTSAHWWIDRRDRNTAYILRELAAALPPVAPAADTQAAINAVAEATIRPESPVSTVVCEIRSVGHRVELRFPEKRDDFRALVKDDLGYRWGQSAWVRTIDDRSGPLADRIAEAGNRLLAAGFAVRIFDPELRAKAIAAEFAPERRRWISREISAGQATGRLAISWPREEDLFATVKTLPGARWVSGSQSSHGYMAVSPERYDAIEDFADAHGFAITDKAREALAAARAAFDRALVARPEPAPESDAAPGAMPEATGEIDPWLLDD